MAGIVLTGLSTLSDVLSAISAWQHFKNRALKLILMMAMS